MYSRQPHYTTTVLLDHPYLDYSIPNNTFMILHLNDCTLSNQYLLVSATSLEKFPVSKCQVLRHSFYYIKQQSPSK